MQIRSTTILLFCVLMARAQYDSTLFGLARGMTDPQDPQSGFVYLAKANHATGVVTNISTTSTAKGFQVVNSGIDPFNKIYYFVDLYNRITGLSLVTGAVVSQHTLNSNSAQYINNIIFSCADTALYCLTRSVNQTTTANGVFVGKVYPGSGQVVNISTVSIANAFQIDNGTIDPYNMVYYFVNENKEVVGASLLTGTVVSTAVLTNSNATHFSGMTYSRSDSTIYGLARGISTPSNPASGYCYLAKLNPLTGVVSNISTVSLANAFVVGSTALDPYNKLYYLIDSDDRLLGVSLATGSVVNTSTLSNTAAPYFSLPVYNCNICPVPQFRKGTSTALKASGQRSSLYTLLRQPGASNSENEIVIRFSEAGHYSVKVLDLSGREIYCGQSDGGTQILLRTDKLSSGLHVIEIASKNQVFGREKIILD